MTETIRIVQITDTHLFADPSKRLLGINTQDSFAAVLQAVKTKALPSDLILLTGDLSQDGSAESYQHLEKQIATLKTPIYWTPGNHDNFAVLKRTFKDPLINASKSITLKKWQLILLNSQIPNEVPGFLDKTELNFLETCLQKQTTHHALICLHHQPLPTGVRWLDKLGLQNAEEFFAVIDRYPQVRGVPYGHIHQEFSSQRHKIPFLATPSTCIQFKQHSAEFALDIIPPGFRVLELYSDGTIKSEIQRAVNFAGFKNADINSKGY